MQETRTPPTQAELRRAEIIRILRESRGLSSAELGRRIGKSEGLIRHIELGSRRANLAVCLAVASALDVPVARIVGDEIAAIIADEPAQAL